MLYKRHFYKRADEIQGMTIGIIYGLFWVEEDMLVFPV